MASCSSQSATTLFPPSSLSWRARDAIDAIESIRKTVRVPFFLYDNITIKNNKTFSVTHEIATLERCNTPAYQYHYGGDYWFLRQLIDHRWRVYDPSEAELYVIPSTLSHQVAKGPGGGPRGQYCRGLTPQASVMAAIGRSDAWRTRQRDHVYIGLDWEYICMPGLPMRNASNPESTKTIPSCSGFKGFPMHTPMLRGFVESHWSDPNMMPAADPLHLQPLNEVAKKVNHGVDMLIAAPYVDNGEGHSPLEHTAKWEEEHKRAFSRHNQTHDHQHGRDVRIFFGGRTSTRIGPGRAQKGYYLRWALMRQWARREKLGTITASENNWDGVLIVDSDRHPQMVAHKDQPAAAFCPLNASEIHTGKAEQAAYMSLIENPRVAKGLPCLPPCSSNKAGGGGVNAMNSGACYGKYTASQVLSRTRFALCLRGDIPTSPRPYDAMRYGSIPLLVSDHIYGVGLPFQCWVPWRLLALQVTEHDFLTDAGKALANVTRSLHPHAEARMRQLIAHFGRDVLWRHPQSRVAENVLLGAARWRNRGRPLRGCCPLEDEIVGER